METWIKRPFYGRAGDWFDIGYRPRILLNGHDITGNCQQFQIGGTDSDSWVVIYITWSGTNQPIFAKKAHIFVDTVLPMATLYGKVTIAPPDDLRFPPVLALLWKKI